MSHHTLGFLGVCQHLSTALCTWVVVPACVQLLWQQMLQICVHLHISACFHSSVCGSGVPSVRGEGMSRAGMVPCSPVCALPSVRSPPHTTTRRMTAGTEACPGGCTLPGFEWNIYDHLGPIFLVTSSSEGRAELLDCITARHHVWSLVWPCLGDE